MITVGSITLWFFDRITKMYALAHYLQAHSIINNYLSFVTEFNQGSSWGILSGDGCIQKGILMLAPLFLIAIVCILYGNKNPFATSLIMAGGLSNLYDRIVYDGVIDFILLSFGHLSFPLFNGADMYISLGIILLLYQFYHHDI
jgi:signal peptidase II